MLLAVELEHRDIFSCASGSSVFGPGCHIFQLGFLSRGVQLAGQGRHFLVKAGLAKGFVSSLRELV